MRQRKIEQAIPSPELVADPYARRVLLGMREAIMGLAEALAAAGRTVMPSVATAARTTQNEALQDSGTDGLNESMQRALRSAERQGVARAGSPAPAAVPATDPGGSRLAQRVLSVQYVCDLNDEVVTDGAGLPLLSVEY